MNRTDIIMHIFAELKRFDGLGVHLISSATRRAGTAAPGHVGLYAEAELASDCQGTGLIAASFIGNAESIPISGRSYLLREKT